MPLDVLMVGTRSEGGEKVCRRDVFAAAEKYKYPQMPVIHR